MADIPHMTDRADQFAAKFMRRRRSNDEALPPTPQTIPQGDMGVAMAVHNALMGSKKIRQVKKGVLNA